MKFFTPFFFFLQQRLKTPFGLVVTWDGKRSAQVQISIDYWNRTCGLCGNFDGDDQNEFVTPEGEMVSFRELLIGNKEPQVPQYNTVTVVTILIDMHGGDLIYLQANFISYLHKIHQCCSVSVGYEKNEDEDSVVARSFGL